MLQRLTAILLIVCCFHTTRAQNFSLEEFIRYTTNDGLNNNYVTSIQQDEQGYLWIGTDAGVNRYDGFSFNNFLKLKNDVTASSGKISRIKEFPAQQLGIISRNGFQLVNTRNTSFRNYRISDSTAFSTYLNDAWDASLLPGNSIALATASGFYVLGEDGQIQFRYDAYTPADIGKKTIRYGREIFKIGPYEYLVFLEPGKLGYFDAKNKNYREINSPQTEWEIFTNQPAFRREIWITRYQLSDHEFMFINAHKNNIVYYDHASKHSVYTQLPIDCKTELNYESRLNRLNDTIFLLNSGVKGFFILKFNRNTGKITCDGKKFLPSLKINCFYTDKDRRLWIGTPEGLFQQKLKKAFLQTYSYDLRSLTNGEASFYCVYRHRDKLYAGLLSQNTGLLVLDAETMKPVKKVMFYGKQNKWNEIVSIQMYHPDTLWLGTNAGVLWYDTGSGKYGKVDLPFQFNPDLASYIHLMPVDQHGNAWFCYLLNGIAGNYNPHTRTFNYFSGNTEPPLPYEKVKSIVYDSYGDVWIGGHSLARWNTKAQAFDTLIRVYGGHNKYYDNILALSTDNNGSLWMHNEENGLLQYIINEKKFAAFTIKDGLPSNIFQSLSPVVNGILWISGSNFLTRFDTRSSKIINYDHRDGMPLDIQAGRKIYYDKSSDLFYIIYQSNLVRFSDATSNTNSKSIDLILQEVSVNNKKSFFLPANLISLKPRENNLGFKFTVIDFEEGHDYRFSYKLNESDTWIELGEQRYLTLSDLQPGDYSILLKVNGKSGEEKVKRLDFSIAFPFWKTGWFLFLTSFIIASILWLIFRYRIRQVRKRANIDKLLAETEMKALHAQMNPHFIANSLNSIREMILSNENKEASHYLSKFAHLMRITLDHSEHSFVTLSTTIDYIERYIEMEKIRTANFTYDIKVDEVLDKEETVLPPMLIQPFIENAIWHGVGADRRHIHIDIEFKKEGNQLVCVIEDNGIGVDESLKQKKDLVNSHHSVAISNIRNRIRLLNEKYGMHCSLNILDKNLLPGNSETGTLIILRMPLETPAV